MFSKGNYIKSMDEIRQSELIQSSRILGIDQVSILDYQDGMNETWQLNDIVQSLHENLSPTSSGSDTNSNNKPSVLITFDDQGIKSSNHISLFHGTKKYIQELRRKLENKNKTRIKLLLLLLIILTLIVPVQPNFMFLKFEFLKK